MRLTFFVECVLSDTIEMIRRACVEQLLSRKAEDIVVIDLRKTADFVDYFLICTGTSDVHVRALADAVIEGLKAEGQRPYHVEGYEMRKWVLIDFVDIIVPYFSGGIAPVLRLGTPVGRRANRAR